MNNPLNDEDIRALKARFRDHLYSMNISTLLDELCLKQPEKDKQNPTVEYTNQMFLVPPIHHILYAAQHYTTVRKNNNKPSVVINIQYMFLFMFGPNTLNSS